MYLRVHKSSYMDERSVALPVRYSHPSALCACACACDL